MRISSLFSTRSPVDGVPMGTAKRSKDKKLLVPLYSGFFSSLTENVMCTNAMFDSLKREIESSVFPYSPKEEIVLTVYESSQTATESVREGVLVGFRKYIMQYRKKMLSELRLRLLTSGLSFLAGVILEFLLFGVFPNAWPQWIIATLDIFAWVFVWQFAAYMTFEFAREMKQIRRLKQILHIQYHFRHWE